MKFVCLGYIEEGKFESMNEKDRNAMMDECFTYDDVLRKGGHFAGGEALQGPRAAVTLRWQNEKAALTDGPAEVVLDLGANDGAYSRLAAGHARYVVAVDGDERVIDLLYRQLRSEGREDILPLVMDLVDPSGGIGWRNRERAPFADRVRPDVTLALALVHHLAIGANVPLPEVVDWLASWGGRVLVEFVHPDDVQVGRLLANKPAGLFDDYRREAFDRLLDARFSVQRQETLPGGTRTLYLAEPKP